MKNYIYYIISLVILFLVITFAIQNSDSVEVKLFTWNVEAPISVILFVSFVIGSGASFLLLTPSMIKRNFELRDRNKTLKDANSRIEKLVNERKEMEVDTNKKDTDPS